MTALLGPLQRAFLALNRYFMAPALDIGLGPVIGNPVTAHLMLLRTRGRRTGLQREAPLGYVIRAGAVYCVAGYGRPTPWYRNLLADPEVEVVLPGRRFRGRAEPVTDPTEWLAAYRALIASFGLVGRLIVPDVRRLDDATLLATHGSLPIVRIRPVDPVAPLVTGPFDPGGRGWLLTDGVALLATAVGVMLIARRRRPG
jgi:deazaflavin-dependent oxidoreductase (nitroreductase family)